TSPTLPSSRTSSSSFTEPTMPSDLASAGYGPRHSPRRTGMRVSSCTDTGLAYAPTCAGGVKSLSGSFMRVWPTRTTKPPPCPGPTTDDMVIPNTGFGGSAGFGASVVLDGGGTSTLGRGGSLVTSTGLGFGGAGGGALGGGGAGFTMAISTLR